MMKTFRWTLIVAALGTLAGCGGDADNNLSDLDARLTNSGDPAINGALQDDIVVDPKLAGQSNGNAGRPADGALPGPLAGGANRADQARRAESAARAALGGSVEAAPKPVHASACTSCSAEERPMTLGALARDQKNGRTPKGGCNADLAYGSAWANRMPDGFAAYPQARIVEAAGVMNGRCNVRVISFTTAASIKSVMDYYATRARRAGYDAEYEIRGADHMLGGMRVSDQAAYVVMAQDDRASAVTAVQIVASNGR